MARKRNAPLRGAQQIGSNMTEVEHGDLTILYSYKTPVAFLAPQGGYVTEYRWSVTTSKHIAKFFDRHGYDRKGAHKLPQEDLEAMVSAGAVTGAQRLGHAPLERRGNPTLRFDEYPLRDDKRKKSPPKYSFYQLTLEDVLSPDFGREQLYIQDQQGFMARVRRNGQVKTWKRDPNRVEIPVKFGMYEAFRITDPSELFVMARDFPINVDPTPAELEDVKRRLLGNPRSGVGDARGREVAVLALSASNDPEDWDYVLAGADPYADPYHWNYWSIPDPQEGDTYVMLRAYVESDDDYADLLAHGTREQYFDDGYDAADVIVDADIVDSWTVGEED